MEPDVSVYDLAENVDMVFNPGNLVVAVDCGNDGGDKHRGVAGQVTEGYSSLLLPHNSPISLSDIAPSISTCVRSSYLPLDLIITSNKCK